MREGRRRTSAIRDHFLEALERSFNFGTTRDIVLHFVDEGRERDAARVCRRISISIRDLSDGLQFVCDEEEVTYGPFAFATAVAITAGDLRFLSSHSALEAQKNLHSAGHFALIIQA
jgi:hypothetical protein